jgi:hypothetical protein
MDKITDGSAASRPLWETLETYARAEIQQFVQRLLVEEVEALLGRRQSERRATADAPPGSPSRVASASRPRAGGRCSGT